MAIAGEGRRPADGGAGDWLRRLGASLRLKVAALIVIFIALPIALYSQFESAEQQRKDFIVRGIQHRNILIAEVLRPVLQTIRPEEFPDLNERLMRFSNNATLLKLLFRPGDIGAEDSFLYVAAAPSASAEQAGDELARLREIGVLGRLRDSCTYGSGLDFSQRAVDGKGEVLTSVVPIDSPNGCWVLISAQPTAAFLNMSIDKPYWQTPEIRVAGIFYLAAVVVAILIAGSMWQSLNRFRRVAREIRHGRDLKRQFSERNFVPELSTVAADLDSLVEDLHHAADDIRQNAEDNAHSLKGHVSAIDMALPALRHAVPSADDRAERSLHIIRTSLDRLQTQISTSLRLDFTKASLLEAPRRRIDVTRIVADVLLHYRDLAAENDVLVVRKLDDGAFVTGAEGTIEVLLECVLDNALSFSPPESTISVVLQRQGTQILLRIDDEGPGVPPDMLEQIFERSVSRRPDSTAGDCDEHHAGLGLWIARQNVTSMGGSITAANRVGGGLSIRITLPLADQDTV